MHRASLIAALVTMVVWGANFTATKVVLAEMSVASFLFLRFAYQTTLATDPNSEERAYIEYVKSAYHQSDVDCVRLIRTLAAGGSIQ